VFFIATRKAKYSAPNDSKHSPTSGSKTTRTNYGSCVRVLRPSRHNTVSDTRFFTAERHEELRRVNTEKNNK
jgi:hypothetical protein